MFMNEERDEILKMIPSYFWAAFAGELVSVFGLDIFRPSEDGVSPLYYIDGTSGWNAALRMACKKLSLDWLYNWYDKLEWYDSDNFDCELVELLETNFVKAEAQKPAWPYYFWLVENETR